MSVTTDGLAISLATWQIENEIRTIGPSDSIYHNDTAAQEALLKEAPWRKDPKYFKSLWISAVSLVKMVMHARSGNRLEIMGLMQGKPVGDSFVILDSFPLPVEGTETRVNAGAEANEFMVVYQDISEKVHRTESIVGWYHSHPGYGCWLSGIDVQTESLYQQHQDPFVAVVIDPLRTCASGKVEIGAFRCYPEDYNVEDEETEEEEGGRKVVPLKKLEDFGHHWRRYYSLPIKVFKSEFDTQLLEVVWAAHWTSVLVSSSLIESKEFYNSQLQDLASKIELTLPSLSSPKKRPGSGISHLRSDDMPSVSSRGEGSIFDVSLRSFSYLMSARGIRHLAKELRQLSEESEEVADAKVQGSLTLLLTKALFANCAADAESIKALAERVHALCAFSSIAGHSSSLAADAAHDDKLL